MADTFQSYARRVDRFRHELTDDALGHAIGRMAKDEARKAASSDLGGDPKFSGWAPELTTRYEIVGAGRVLLTPGSRRAAGPWTVAERGRNVGETGLFLGPGINRRTGVTSRTKSGGVRKVRSFQSRRWNGVTRGFGTASAAHDAINGKLGRVVETHLGRAIRKAF